jgi:PDZ domain
VIGAEVRDAQLFVPAGIGSTDGRDVFGLFKIDTASLDAAGLNLNFVRDHALIGPSTREIVVSGVAVGGGTEGRLLRAESLWLGSRHIERPLISYTVDSKGFENRADAGTLGVGALARFRLILDYPRRRVILEDAGPGPLRAPEDLSGALLVSPAPEFARVVVQQVVPGSAAAEAGLKEGDEIASAGGRAVTLAEARRLMEQPGPVSLRVRRQGTVRDVTLTRRSMLP